MQQFRRWYAYTIRSIQSEKYGTPKVQNREWEKWWGDCDLVRDFCTVSLDISEFSRICQFEMKPKYFRGHHLPIHGVNFEEYGKLVLSQTKLQKFKMATGFTDKLDQCGFCMKQFKDFAGLRSCNGCFCVLSSRNGGARKLSKKYSLPRLLWR